MSVPAEGDQLVGLWAWFWVGANSYGAQSDTAADPAGLLITLTATPGELRLCPGDDDITGQDAVVVGEGSALVWERGMGDTLTDCRHFWDWPSKHAPCGVFITRVEASYEFTWQATGCLAVHLSATTGTIGQTTVNSQDTELPQMKFVRQLPHPGRYHADLGRGRGRGRGRGEVADGVATLRPESDLEGGERLIGRFRP